jgi:boron transporter
MLFSTTIEFSKLIQFKYSWFMGVDSLQRNGITDKFLFLMRDKTLTAPDEPLKRVRKSRIIMFMGMQLIG